jgi:hypothetical protein
MPIGSSGDISIHVRSLDWHGGGSVVRSFISGSLFPFFYIGHKSRVFGWGRMYE